jgi:hypothetical protein
MADIVDTLNRISEAPSQKEAFDKWLELEDAIAFLRDNSQQDKFVVYASDRSAFIHAVVVPVSSLNPPDIDDLMSWNCTPFSSWGITVQFSEPRAVWISSPLDQTDSKTLDQGEQLVFARDFDGRSGKKSYYEILQKFTHLFGLHYMEERHAYCRLDKHGDVEDVIRIVEIPGKGEEFGTNVVAFNRDVLDEYLVLTDSVIVRMFDFTRHQPGGFNGWATEHEAGHQSHGDIHYRSHVEPGYASYMRGFQIVRPLTTREAIVRRFDHTATKDRQYASFIAHDWKNKIVKEISCAPGETANYFTESDLPFEMSPVFFKPEVLLKYKSDSDKYQLSGRSISCRGAWSLQTYDVNEAGQVHTYLVYLRTLPYEEQLYWKSYNEKPKASISKRALTTDFEGKWHSEYDPLDSLKGAVSDLNRDQVPWWTLRSKNLLDQLHYPVTTSADEWATEILNLDQLVVEGFETKWLRKKAQSLGRTPDINFASLRLVEECLVGLSFEGDDAKKILAPLKTAHDLRSKVKGHASGKDGAAAKKQVLKDHGTYKKHFHALCQTCDESIRAIAEAFKGTN